MVSFIQFFGALYFTLIVDGLLCKGDGFWSPEFYRRTKNALENIGCFTVAGNLETTLQHIEAMQSKQIHHTRRRGCIWLIYACLFLAGSVFDSKPEDGIFLPLIASIGASYFIFMLICEFVILRWRWVIGICLMISASEFCIFKFADVGYFFHPTYLKAIIVTLIVLPLVYQVALFFLLSTTYIQYIYPKIKKETVHFKDAKEKIQEGKSDFLGKDYHQFAHEAYAHAKKSSSDIDITPITKHYTSKLLTYLKEYNYFSLTCFYIFKTKENIFENEDIEQILVDKDKPVCSTYHNEESINIDKFVKEYHLMPNKPKIKFFAQDNGLNEAIFRARYNEFKDNGFKLP